MSKLQIILKYLQYLSKWNQTASLLSIIEEIKSEISIEESGFYNANFTDLLSIVCIEYEDTQAMTSDEIMPLQELLDKIKIEHRNRRIDGIIM